ncbi:MAG: nucleotidyltransferase domain-containing protein [Candidatus Thorarchaeota archaeon]
MNYIEGIEGDYIKTKEENLYFDVKGLLHPNNLKICFLRFYPHPEGKRVKNSIHFKKVYNLKERFIILKEKYPKYIYFSSHLDLEVQGVKTADIAKIYTPRSFYKKLTERSQISKIEKFSKDLCNLFIIEGDLNENSIGITGSTMIGLNTNDSDIDIIIYGTKTSLKFQEKLKKVFDKANILRRFNIDEFKSHYHWRVGGSGILFEDFLKIEKRKQHQGKFGNFDFFIRYIKSPEDWKGNFYDYKYKNCGRVKLKASIVNSEDSIFTPCSYKIKPIEIIETTKSLKKKKLRNIIEINSFRGRFCEQAKQGEKVFVEGKLEKVNYKDEPEYFRILLTDHTQDRMFII